VLALRLHHLVPVETLYNWLAIAAHSVSPFPLFPGMRSTASGEEWPSSAIPEDPRMAQAQGFRQVQALKAEVSGDIYLRVSIYQDEASMLRSR